MDHSSYKSWQKTYMPTGVSVKRQEKSCSLLSSLADVVRMLCLLMHGPILNYLYQIEANSLHCRATGCLLDMNMILRRLAANDVNGNEYWFSEFKNLGAVWFKFWDGNINNQ